MTKFETIYRLFEENADADKAHQMAAYMKNHFLFFGIPTPKRRAATQAFLKEERKCGEIDWDLLDQCWQDDHRECHYFVGDYLRALKKYLTFEDISKLENYARSQQWWDSIDFLNQIIGNIGLTDCRVDEVMRNWARDEDFWIRRLAIEHQLSRKDKTNPDLLEDILVANFGSQEFFINKAIGWALRDYSKSNPDWVRNFIQKYEAHMAPLSIREGSKYVSF
ncbi:DNA alkylation repair protein [Streptococcus dentiloxodontae]